MERVKWEKPRAEVQAFVADDYVAACWDVLCDGPAAAAFPGRWVYQDIDGDMRLDLGEPILSRNAYGDNKTYLVKTEGVAPSYNAMVLKLDGDDYPVYYFGNDHISLLNLNSYKHNNRPNHS